jgi:hypothetical protein
VKKIVCLLLVLCFGLMANWAQAHATFEAADDIAHVLSHANSDIEPDADHDGHCGPAHCCHTATMVPMTSAVAFLANASLPLTHLTALHPRFAPPDIERPKWSAATLFVAGL